MQIKKKIILFLICGLPFPVFRNIYIECVFFKFNELNLFTMKRFSFNSKEKRNFSGIEVLNATEMLKVRGGDDQPPSRRKDLIDPIG